ncbi:MAG: ABC transporter ATP-binding protein, partial [Oscillospiraceae bacterium]|nr:ABC transporter ATP-binding protein [Oscillospiraceae bacterium]
MIEVQNLVKQYGDHYAVDDLSFTVKKGQIYGFLGPNGAGKSTTMNIMTGYIGMTSGKVVINGHDIMEEPELARKSIGYLPEIPPLYTEMTAREYLEFAAELKSIPKAKIRDAVNDVMKRTKIVDHQDRLIKNLSKGFRQRVGLAQALIGYPEIIILDEPTVGLDPKQIIEIRDLIKSLAGKHTIILSSHILSEVQEICDHILIIHHGKLIADGTPDELERRMRSSKIELTVKSEDPEAVRAAIESVSGVKSFLLDKPKNGEMPVKLVPEKDTDIRENVFNAFAAKSLPLLMIRPENVSLESIFIELTADKTIRRVKRKRVKSPEGE